MILEFPQQLRKVQTQSPMLTARPGGDGAQGSLAAFPPPSCWRCFTLSDRLATFAHSTNICEAPTVGQTLF